MLLSMVKKVVAFAPAQKLMTTPQSLKKEWLDVDVATLSQAPTAGNWRFLNFVAKVPNKLRTCAKIADIIRLRMKITECPAKILSLMVHMNLTNFIVVAEGGNNVGV